MFEIRVKHKFIARHALTNYRGATEKATTMNGSARHS